MDVQLITNSRMRAFQTCQRLHQISYVLGYRPIERSYALDWGTLMHKLLEAWWTSWMEGNDGKQLDRALWLLDTLEADDLDKAKARVVMAGYDARWAPAMADIEVLAVEQEFNYDSGRGYNLAGKIDGIIRRGGQTLILEHKNTSADFGPADSYWTKLRMEPQVSQYFRGAVSLGYEPTGCLWDVIRRPEIKPYKATPEASRKFTKEGKLYANQRAADETPEEYAERLTQLVCSDPANWYARQIVVRLQDELEEFDRDTQALADGCVQAAADEFHHAPRNPDSCAKYGRVCEYFPVCSGAGSLSDESRYRKVYNTHEELNEQASNG